MVGHQKLNWCIDKCINYKPGTRKRTSPTYINYPHHLITFFPGSPLKYLLILLYDIRIF